MSFYKNLKLDYTDYSEQISKDDDKIILYSIETPEDSLDFLTSQDIQGIYVNKGRFKLNDLILFENEKFCSKVKYLVIYSSRKYHVTSEIEKLTQLKELILEGNISQIHENIGNLLNLEVLTLNYCYDLHIIPFEIYQLPKLKELTINSLGYYENFSPKISNLKNLQKLTLLDHSPYISEQIAELENLTTLITDTYHPNIYINKNITSLSVRIRETKERLSNINNLENLVELQIDIDKREYFHENFLKLSNLKYLSISNYEDSEFIEMEILENIELLIFSYCKGITAMPSFVYKLHKLKFLGLFNLPNIELNEEDINKLKDIQNVEIYECPKL